MKLISKVTVIYSIADDFCKEFEWELNKKNFVESTSKCKLNNLLLYNSFWRVSKLVCYLLNNGTKSVVNVITFGDWGGKQKKHLLRGGVGAR